MNALDLNAISLDKLLKAALCLGYYECNRDLIIAVGTKYFEFMETGIIVKDGEQDMSAADYKDIDWEPHKNDLLQWFLTSPYVVCPETDELIKFARENDSLHNNEVCVYLDEVCVQGIALPGCSTLGIAIYKEKSDDAAQFCVVSKTLLMDLLYLDNAPAFDGVYIYSEGNSLVYKAVEHFWGATLLLPKQSTLAKAIAADMLCSNWATVIPGPSDVGSTGAEQLQASVTAYSTYPRITALLSTSGKLLERVNKLTDALRYLDEELPEKLEIILENDTKG